MVSAVEEYWEACSRGELRYEVCSSCGKTQTYPRGFCAFCGSRAVEQKASSGLGTVYSRSVVTRSPWPELAQIVPYTIVLVTMDEGFRVMGHAADGLDIGARAKVSFRELAGRSLPFFTPVALGD